MKKFIISTIAAAALTAGLAGAASTASAAMPALGAKIESAKPAARDGAVQNVGYYVVRRRCVNYYRTYYSYYHGRYFRVYVGRRCYFYRRYYY